MVVQPHTKLSARIHNAAGDRNVSVTRLRIPRGMIVNEDEGCRANLQGPTHDLTRVDRRFVDGANANHLLRKKMISAVQEQNPQLLRGCVRDCRMHIIMQRL